jgi:hypothetical protein
MLMNFLKRKRTWLLLALLLLLGGGVWSAWPDRKLARVHKMRKELFDPAARSLPAGERRRKWQELRAATEKLSPAQRQELAAQRRSRRREQMARYSRLSPREKTRFLDELIRRMEQRRQAGGFGPGGNAGGQAGGRDRSSTGREERRQERLDASTPAERALMTQFFRDLATRRQQLGLPAGRGSGPLR